MAAWGSVVALMATVAQSLVRAKGHCAALAFDLALDGFRGRLNERRRRPFHKAESARRYGLRWRHNGGMAMATSGLGGC